MIKIAVVEDDAKYRNTLLEYLKKYEAERGTKQECQMFENADAFLETFEAGYDIILMDIEMPGTNGMEAAEQIRKKDSQVVIMFITNMAHFAIKGYEVGALYFVLKPIEYFNFANKLDRAISLAENRISKQIVLQTGNGMVKLDSKDIYYVEIQNHILSYHTKMGTYELRGSLKSAEEMLPKGMFAKCSNWCLVGLSHVLEVRDDMVIVEDTDLQGAGLSSANLQMSRRSKKSFMAALIQNVGRS